MELTEKVKTWNELSNENAILRKNLEHYKKISGADEILELKRRNLRQANENARLWNEIKYLKGLNNKKQSLFNRLISWMQQ